GRLHRQSADRLPGCSTGQAHSPAARLPGKNRPEIPYMVSSHGQQRSIGSAPTWYPVAGAGNGKTVRNSLAGYTPAYDGIGSVQHMPGAPIVAAGGVAARVPETYQQG